MTTPTIYTETELLKLELPELRAIYFDVLGRKTKARTEGFLIRKIIAGQEARDADAATAAAQAAQAPQAAAEPEAPTEEAAPEAASEQEPTVADDGADAPQGDTPEPTDADDPWQGAKGIAERIEQVRAAASTTVLTDLPGVDKPQARVVAELQRQREALDDAQGLRDADDKGALLAMLSNRRTHSRPGVVAAIRQHLVALGCDAAGGDGELPLAMRPLPDLSVDELRQVYEEVVGRETGSADKGYLVWKIREARKGRVTVGAIQRGSGDPSQPHMVLPLRMATSQVEVLDAAWKRLKASSRMAFMREAIAAQLEAKGEGEAAATLRA